MPSRFGPQPARLLLRRRGYILRDLAEQLGVGERHFLNVLAGYTRPRPEVIKDLPSLVGIPLTKLFTEEVLAKPHDASKNPWRELS
ncbi:helix-turn-helix domain-containing protein [Micromonospora sp. CPCC 205561]|uniref:helix-turn-helix domain-containing protein n=1 Tax=Micromonospora sp. CPCC 205561 TaxID=3122407 RepID=UPI002FEF764C